jgi:hypothetical protein
VKNKETQSDDRLVSEVKPFLSYLGTDIRKREELDEIVEAPLLEAARVLYDKGIRTTGSSANGKDVSTGFAFISIDYDSLSDENKEVAERICGEVFRGVTSDEGKPYSRVSIRVPLTEESTVQEAEDASVELAEQFKEQEMTWATVYSIGEMHRFMALRPGEDIEIDGDTMEVPGYGFFYDEENGRFYGSQEQFERIQAWKKELEEDD